MVTLHHFQTAEAPGLDYRRFDPQYRRPAEGGHPASETPASGQPAHGVARLNASATKWCCTGWLAPQKQKISHRKSGGKTSGFRATDCNTGSA